MGGFGSLGSNKNNKKKSQNQERKVAEELGGRPTPNSGGIDGFKGDVSLEEYLIECKFTGRKAYSLPVAELNKASREAFEADKEPLMIIRIDKGVGSLYLNQWFVIPENVFEDNFSDTDFEMEEIKVTSKSYLFGAVDINRISKKAALAEKDPLIRVKFYKGISLGVCCTWNFVPYDCIKDLGIFENE